MKRGEIYFHEFTDSTGRKRRVPVLVVSENKYNGTAGFATCVRISMYNNNPCPQHVFVPGDAFEQPGQISDSYVLCETVSSTKQSTLRGPVSFLPDGYHMNKVCEGLKYQMGMIPFDKVLNDGGMEARVLDDKPIGGWYSAAYSQQRRDTTAAEEEE